MADENTQAILDILMEHAEEKPESVNADTTLESMGIDSLALVEIIFDLEERFDITIPDPSEIPGLESEFETAGDVISAIGQLIAQPA